jgi:serine/threonine protein kinase
MSKSSLLGYILTMLTFFSRFETISPLNNGSFGMVSLAKDLTNGEHVAIKTMTKPTALSACPSGLAIDEKSEELSAHLTIGQHDHIVNLIDSFETESHQFLVLEFCSQGDLYEAIRMDRGPLETANVRHFMLQLVDAVEFMHSKGIYHRDIKPENIFLMEKGTMKLGDLGLSTTEKWSYESKVGSDRYMAPEQYDHAGNGYATEKADIWAIGIVLLNILFSRNPFENPSEADPLFADYLRDNQSMFDIFEKLSLDGFDVIRHALAIDPEKRSLSAIRDALNSVVTFTTDDEMDDEFCNDIQEIIPPSANREPLRTPSIQSPHLANGGSFPWAQALQKSPAQPIRQLSNIHETGSYSEDLFSSSAELGKDDWISVMAETPSVASVLDSGFGMSFKSMAIRPRKSTQPPRSDPVAIPASAPALKPFGALSSVFGKKDEIVSKSWSDLFDEEQEEEEEQREHEAAIEKRREQNARSWSHESMQADDVTVRPLMPTKNSGNTSPDRKRKLTESWRTGASPIGADGVNENDGFFFEDHRPSPPRTSFFMDKWAALGDRRRAFGAKVAKSASTSGSATPRNRISGLGFIGLDGVLGQGLQERKPDIGDIEWVGGWNE